MNALSQDFSEKIEALHQQASGGSLIYDGHRDVNHRYIRIVEDGDDIVIEQEYYEFSSNHHHATHAYSEVARFPRVDAILFGLALAYFACPEPQSVVE